MIVTRSPPIAAAVSDSQVSRTVTPTNFARAVSDGPRAIKRVRSISGYDYLCHRISHKFNSCDVEMACNGTPNAIHH